MLLSISNGQAWLPKVERQSDGGLSEKTAVARKHKPLPSGSGYLDIESDRIRRFRGKFRATSLFRDFACVQLRGLDCHHTRGNYA